MHSDIQLEFGKISRFLLPGTQSEDPSLDNSLAIPPHFFLIGSCRFSVQG